MTMGEHSDEDLSDEEIDKLTDEEIVKRGGIVAKSKDPTIRRILASRGYVAQLRSLGQPEEDKGQAEK